MSLQQQTRGMGDPQTRGMGDPQKREMGDPQTRGMGDPQKREMGDPQIRGMGDPQKREMGDPQKREMGDPQIRGMGNPQTRGMGDPQTRGMGDPQTRGMGDPQTRVMGDPQKREMGDPQKREMGDPQKREMGDPQKTEAETDMKSRAFGEPQIRALGDPLLAVARTVCRVLLHLLPVYVVGRLGLSVTWLIFGLFLWTFWHRNKKSKVARMRAAWELLDNECLEVTRGLNGQQLPAWVNFPDVERVEWINKVLKQMWPYFGMYMEKLFQEKIEPLVRASNDHLKAFTFTKVHFGEKSPRINGVKAYTKAVDTREVILDLQLCYNADCEINVEVKKLCKAGVNGMQIHGTLRLILAPLMSDVPFVGAVTFFFIQKPFLDINWTGLTNLLEIPGVSDMSDGMIVDLIASYLVLPNRFTFPLSSQVNAAQLRFPLPHGVLRVYLYEAENLIPKDTYLRGLIKGKSDPYGVLRVGNQTFKSKTIRENLNPLWNEMYEFVVHEVPGQDLEVDVYDEDPDKDDFLGSLVIGLEGVMKDRIVDEWFPLSDVASGTVHLKLEWWSLVSNHEKLCAAQNGFSTAMVIVYLDSASGLPKNHLEYSNSDYAGRRQRYTVYPMSEREPSSYVTMTIGKKTVKSKTCSATKNPVWEQAFVFFIQDVHMQHLHLEVKDNDNQCALGTLDFPLHRTLSMDDLTCDQRFPLANSAPNSVINMKVVLRVLHIEDPDPQSVYAGLTSLKHGPVSIKRTPREKGKAQNPPEAQQTRSVPQNKALRRESSSQRTTQTAPPQRPPHPPANQSVGSSASPSAPQTPKLKHLRRIAPSLISLNSVASSVFDPSDDLSGPGVFGEINISVRYAFLRRCLIVSINGCRNLIHCSTHGADPYVRIYLLPDRRWASRKKTSVKKKTLNPIYNERFEFLVSLEDAKKRMLDIAVKNNRPFGSQDRKEMGKTLVDLSQLDVDQGITDWFELTASGHPTS